MVITSRNKGTKFRHYSSSQLRFAMTSTVITGLVLIFLNLFCAQFSRELFFQSKRIAMVEKALLTAEELGNTDVLTAESALQTVADMGGPSATRLLVTDTAGRVLYDTAGQVAVDDHTQLAQIAKALEGKDNFTWNYKSGQIQAAAAVPIVSYSTISGCVYMMDHDTEQGHFIQSLQVGILMISVLLELFLILFSLTHTRRFSSRLRKITASMRTIQSGDYTHKLTLDGNDELAALGDEFNELTSRLHASENIRRQFVSDASHELKTPLASIKLLTDSILQYDMDAETTREFVEDIGNEADRLNRMTLKLLALTKGEQPSPDEDAEIIYLAPTVRRAAKMLSAIALEKDICVELDLEEDSAVLVQEDDLYQIAFNLAENGIKYNAPGGKLTISLQRLDDIAVLRFTDTGMGIPEESLAHIFERFYRVDKARSRQDGGSGLGLAIVHSMVERNSGEITVESTVGQGTTFTVTFHRFDLATVEE